MSRAAPTMKTEAVSPSPVFIVGAARLIRSEEHTSELQSQSNLVRRLLLEKKYRLRPRHAVRRALGVPLRVPATPLGHLLAHRHPPAHPGAAPPVASATRSPSGIPAPHRGH